MALDSNQQSRQRREDLVRGVCVREFETKLLSRSEALRFLQLYEVALARLWGTSWEACGLSSLQSELTAIRAVGVAFLFPILNSSMQENLYFGGSVETVLERSDSDICFSENGQIAARIR